jgi:Fe-S cluster assembly protein SufD
MNTEHDNYTSPDYRQNGLITLKKIGLPTKRTEIWRGSNVSIFQKDMLPIAERLFNVVLEENLFDSIDSTKIVFVNGYYHANLSDKIPDSLSFLSLAEAITLKDSSLSMIGSIQSPQEQATIALNAINVRDGAILKIGHGVKLDKPIHLIFKNPISGVTAYGRVLIVADTASESDFIVSHDTVIGAFENHVTEVFVGDNAHISYTKSVNAVDVHFGAVLAQLSRNANLNIAYYTKGADLLRNETVVNLNGEGANVNIGAGCYASEKKINDHNCIVVHKVPHCTSSQVFKNLVNDTARVVTRSKTLVQHNAQKTDAKQMLQALLLSEGASNYAKPELEIYADDVKCTHGSTVGRLDENALFYLKSRGIPHDEARKLMTRAFLSEALSDMLDNDILNIILADFDKAITTKTGHSV